MKFDYRYLGRSQIKKSRKSVDIAMAPDTLREPTFFVGDLNQHIPFREAISALNKVVVSDLRTQPKDRTEYFQWLQENEQSLLEEFLGSQGDLDSQIQDLQDRIKEVHNQSNKIMKPFYQAQKKYFNYLYKVDRDAWFVLDPVITVHPDQIFFECFSQDESSYGCLSCSHNVFKKIDDIAFGTTNIDYSSKLYDEFQKIRTYKNTQFKIDPSGFNVQTGNDAEYHEEKIDLPDTWVKGFLQVSAAMTLPKSHITLSPMDVYNICRLLRMKKEKMGPRSLRFILESGKPPTIIFEPWNQKLVCQRSIYHGNDSQEIRIWGRRRLHILERLIPVSKKFDVYLLGTGLPSFFVADMGDMTFTLGLSGWTANDWSKMGSFDLLLQRQTVSDPLKEEVFSILKKDHVKTSKELANELQESIAQIESALFLLIQAGKVVYDLDNTSYRLRELTQQPIDFEKLSFSDPREESANRFIQANLVNLLDKVRAENITKIRGTIMDDGKEFNIEIDIDQDLRLVEGQCQCEFYIKNKVYKGPCEHMLALRKLSSSTNLEAKH
ncbi:SWIM zinc finger family protein [Pleionea sediminis]|uniref:SWIM zinc finger family protein n=1 Tax=Pleionea sediminis TaxID=2569479 RepID=UPI001184D130|nr:SWIM zinc finger family protein [Pleionea sediminis]